MNTLNNCPPSGELLEEPAPIVSVRGGELQLTVYTADNYRALTTRPLVMHFHSWGAGQAANSLHSRQLQGPEYTTACYALSQLGGGVSSRQST